MITLWIAATLTLFTFGLAHRATLNLKISRNQKNRLKAYYLAKAGIHKAIALADEDFRNSQTKGYDTALECGINLEDKDPKEIFCESSNSADEGFRVGFYGDSNEFVYGMRDEESKINAASACLAAILEKKEIEQSTELAQTIHSWVSPENSLDNLGSPQIPKKEALKTPEELILILEYFFSTKNTLDAKEKARELYEKFKDSVTIYGGGKININTTNRESLEILAKTLSLQNNSQIDTYAIALRIVELRDNPQRNFYKNISELLSDIQEDQNLDVEQKGFFNSFLLPFLKCKSDFLRINSFGYVGSTTRQITMVYDRLLKKTVYWHEN